MPGVHPRFRKLCNQRDVYPHSNGQVAGTLSVVDSASNSPQTTVLQGIGVATQLTSITVTPASTSTTAGTTQAFTATGNYNNGTTSNLTNSVTWTASPTSVATINSAGVATGIVVGTAMITATSGSISGSAMLTVNPPTLVSLAVTPINVTISSLSSTQQYTATGTYTDGSTQNLTSVVSWSTGNAAVATIGATGLATGVGAGTTAVMAMSGSISGSTNLTVGTAPTLTSIAVTPAAYSVALGASEQYTATGTYSDNSTQNLTASGVTWSAGGVTGGNSSVGTISSTGLYKAPSTLPNPAQVTITAASTATPSVSGSATVTVAQVSVSVSPSTAQVPGGGTQQFTATVTGPTNTAVTWSAGGMVGGNATVGTINSAGVYTAPTTVPNPAQVTITATSAADGVTSASATATVVVPITVTVTPPAPQVHINTTQQYTATVNEDTYAVQLLDFSKGLISLSKHDFRKFDLDTAPFMPSYKGRLSDSELRDLVAYLWSLKRQGRPE